MAALKAEQFRYLAFIPADAGFVILTEMRDQAAMNGYYPLPAGDATEIIEHLQKRITADMTHIFLVQKLEGSSDPDFGQVHMISRNFVCPVIADLDLPTGCDQRQHFVFAQPA